MSLWTPKGEREVAENLDDTLAPPNRAERRVMRNSLRAYRKAAARARDRSCSERGVGTPGRGISVDIRNREPSRHWFEGERWLTPRRTRRRRRRRQARRA